MSKIKVLHGGGVRCDIVHVRETATEIIHENPCKSIFVTYSLPSIARKQAEAAGWKRTKVRYVTWSGDMPDTPKKKVDICPLHADLVLTQDEFKAKKKAERAAAKAANAAPPKLELVKDAG